MDPLSPINPLPSIIVSHKPQLVHLGYLILADPALGGARLGELHAEVLLQRSGGREAAAALDVDEDGGRVGVDDLRGALVAVEAGHPRSHADDGLQLWDEFEDIFVISMVLLMAK